MHCHSHDATLCWGNMNYYLGEVDHHLTEAVIARILNCQGEK